ncbi:hypothetical protein [Streptomyces alfalfae]|uniref:TetR/AcrR family transcriptional regulator n=1 Tax=Streptomyces alfalfae TaxID=1642299 RepID=A0ABM6GMH1_9ACTN|nr:hypothetical protein [Streptomyces alfalfae]APY84822.1 hypothetical protein A7J05_02810 [Streptomyces alfalfae]QUI35361.1 hypothetical protein H9W91_34455 [Streptomyces alfalfae]
MNAVAKHASPFLVEQQQIIGQRDNALLQAARDGRVGRQNLGRMVQADQLCLYSETVAYGVLLARFPSGPAADLFAGLNSALRSVKPSLDRCAKALDAPPVSALDPSKAADAFAFPMAVSWMCLHAGPVAAALALWSDFAAYARESQELVRTLTDAGADVPEAFLGYYSRQDPSELLDLAAGVVEDDVREGGTSDHATSVAAMLLAGLDGFWRFAAETEQGPSSAGAGRVKRQG